jgi:LysM repeat protein
VDPPAPKADVTPAARPLQEQTPRASAPSAETPSAPDATYIVQEGDNLYRIARKFNVSREVLTAYNRLAEPNRILVGQRLRIPR